MPCTGSTGFSSARAQGRNCSSHVGLSAEFAICKMCSPTGCTFCAGMSIFGAIFMFILGVCIKNDYPYLGEWFKPVEGQGTPTDEQISEAAQNCFTVMGIYLAFTVLALITLCWQKRKAKAA